MAVKTNFEVNGYKYYKITKTIGHNADGSPIKKTFYGNSKSEAENKATEYNTKIKDGLPQNFQLLTLGKMLHDWLWNIKRISKDIKSSTFDRYETTFRNHIENSELAGLQLYNITTLPIQRYYNNLYEKKIATTNQINEINKILKMFFTWCIEHDYIKRNPCSSNLIEIPGNNDIVEDEEDSIQIFTDKEISNIIATTKEKLFTYDINIIVLFALSTGLRQGEILGLQYKYLDLKNRTIKVRKTLKKIKVYSDIQNKEYTWNMQLIKPKTQSSIRTVDIPSKLVPILRKYLETVKQRYKNNALEFTEESLIFTTDSCLPIDSGNLSRAWKRFLERAKVKYRKFHALRHTYASILFKNGADILEVKELLGHSDSDTTEKIYIYVYPNSKKNAVKRINYVFN